MDLTQWVSSIVALVRAGYLSGASGAVASPLVPDRRAQGRTPQRRPHQGAARGQRPTNRPY